MLLCRRNADAMVAAIPLTGRETMRVAVFCCAMLCGALALDAATAPALAQAHVTTPDSKSSPAVEAPRADPLAVPGFWDPRRRPERPDLSRITGIRFLTEIDYPPFDYAGADGQPAGFNVDLARAICEEIKVTCTIQMRRFDTLLDTLAGNGGDAVIASMAVTPDMRRRVDFSDPYYRTPARFVSRKDIEIDDVRPEQLEGKKVGGGRRHVASRRTCARCSPSLSCIPIRTPTRRVRRCAAARSTCCSVTAISLAFWLNGTDSAGCCAFRGGPFLESRFFGEGVGIAVQQGQRPAAAGVQLGAVPALGERQVHRPVAALFPDQPVLI